MRALIFDGPGRLRLGHVPEPRPSDGEVLVRVRTATICGTDLRIVDGRKTRNIRPGHPIGHECEGIVAGVGDGVDGFTPGDRVGLCVVVSCGACRHCCELDQENLCPEKSTLGFHTDGAFAEFILVPAQAVRRGNLFHLDCRMGEGVGALLEPMACVIQGQEEMGLIPRGPSTASCTPRSLLIFGAGPIGLLHMMIARTHLAPGPSKTAARELTVTVVEPRPLRRSLASEFGANEVCAPRDFHTSERFDAAILATSDPDAVGPAVQAVRRGGVLCLFAGYDGDGRSLLDVNLIHYHQLRVVGASESRRRDYAKAVSLVSSGTLDPAPLISDRLPLEEYAEAFSRARRGVGLKIAFDLG